MNVVFRSIASRFVFQRECAESIDFFFYRLERSFTVGLNFENYFSFRFIIFNKEVSK